MEKWKKKIIKSMVDQWSKNRISANDILQYFSNPKNYFEITQEMLDCYERTIKFRLIKLFWPIYEYFHKDEIEKFWEDVTEEVL